MLLENDKIRLRALEPEDLDILYRLENNAHLWIHGNTLAPYSKLMLRQYISEAQQQGIYEAKQLRLMIELKGEQAVIGSVDLYDFDFHNSRSGVGILIDENYQKQNYGSQTLGIIKDYAFTFLRIKQLYAFIATDNNSSIRLFEKSGYVYAGKLRDWICCNSTFKDVCIYQLINK
jgi:diamine N-acetyltransferase